MGTGNTNPKELICKGSGWKSKLVQSKDYPGNLENTVHLGAAGNLTASAALSPRADGSPPHSLSHPNASKSRTLHSPTCLKLVHFLGLENGKKVTGGSHLSAPLLPLGLSQHYPDLMDSSLAVADLAGVESAAASDSPRSPFFKTSAESLHMWWGGN